MTFPQDRSDLEEDGNQQKVGSFDIETQIMQCRSNSIDSMSKHDPFRYL